jgi:hypothetical protein
MRAILSLLLVGCAQYRLTYKTGGEDAAADTGADTARAQDTDVDTDTAWDTDVDTDTEPGDTAVPTPAVCARILVYSTDSSGREHGRFDGLAAEPGLARFAVDIRERAADGPLDAALLAGYSQLWLFGTDRGLDSSLEFDEVRAIRDFVDTNAGLFVAGEHEDADTSYADDVALVAELYGVSFEGSFREASDGAATAVTGADAALLAGVAELPGFASVAELTPIDTAVRVAGRIGGAPALAYRDDLRVAFDRSWEGWSDAWRGVGDQAVLVGDVAERLEWCAP